MVVVNGCCGDAHGTSMLRFRKNEQRVGAAHVSAMPRLFGKKKKDKKSRDTTSDVASSVSSDDAVAPPTTLHELQRRPADGDVENVKAEGTASGLDDEEDDVLQKRLEVLPTTSSEFRCGALPLALSSLIEHARTCTSTPSW